jgi:hypothetical protein
LTPTPSITPSISSGFVSDLCMSFTYCKQSYTITFVPNGTYNSYNTWISQNGQYTIIYNGTNWSLTGLPVCGNLTPLIISNASPSSTPTTGWSFLGGGNSTSGTITVTLGDCVTSPLSLSVSKTDSCTNNGTILATATGGLSPYTYSINNITYQNSPLFNNLVSGNYTLYVQDSVGNVVNVGVTISQLSSQNYVVNLYADGLPFGNYLSTNWLAQPGSLFTTPITNGRNGIITINPALPNGVYIELDIEYSEAITQSPAYPIETHVTWDTTETVVNGLLTLVPTDGPTTNNIVNNGSCGGQFSVVSTVTNVKNYSSVQIYNTTNIDLSLSITSQFISQNVGSLICKEKFSYLLKYTIRNVKIYGASCATVTIGNNNFGATANYGAQFF